jgi:hypothetical protein
LEIHSSAKSAGAAPIGVLPLFVPEDSIIVRHAGDKIGQPVPIHIFHVNESRRPEIEFRMKNPLPIAGIRGRFKPSLGSNNVIPSIFDNVPCPGTRSSARVLMPIDTDSPSLARV